MKLEDQVCSLKLAKKLKELGVKQDSVFYWVENYHVTPVLVSLNDVARKMIGESYFSAFTVAELGEMLPAVISGDEDLKMDSCKNTENHWMVAYFTNFKKPPRFAFIVPTEANARAETLVYLIENKLMEV